MCSTAPASRAETVNTSTPANADSPAGVTWKRPALPGSCHLSLQPAAGVSPMTPPCLGQPDRRYRRYLAALGRTVPRFSTSLTSPTTSPRQRTASPTSTSPTRRSRCTPMCSVNTRRTPLVGASCDGSYSNGYVPATTRRSTSPPRPAVSSRQPGRRLVLAPARNSRLTSTLSPSTLPRGADHHATDFADADVEADGRDSVDGSRQRRPRGRVLARIERPVQELSTRSACPLTVTLPASVWAVT